MGVEEKAVYLRRKCGRFLICAEEFGGLGAFDIFDFLIIEEADSLAKPYHP